MTTEKLRGPQAACGYCGHLIVWARHVAGGHGRSRSMPLNPYPDPAGNVAVFNPSHTQLTARVLTKGEHPQTFEKLAMPHFATCPNRPPRTRKPVAT